MTNQVEATAPLVEKVSRYNRAKAATTRWQQERDTLKDEILEELGYDPEDPKPEPVDVVDEHGEVVFSIARGTWRGLNQKYLKEHRPDVYAECETSKATLTIKYSGD